MEVVEQVIGMVERDGAIAIQGNHDERLVDVVLERSEQSLMKFTGHGGRQTAESYTGIKQGTVEHLVERVVLVMELLQVADPDVRLGSARAGERYEPLGGVDTAHLGAPVGGGPQEDARAAADLEHAVARPDREALDGCLVRRQLLLLGRRPSLCAGPPAPPPPLCLRLHCVRRRHRPPPDVSYVS